MVRKLEIIEGMPRAEFAAMISRKYKKGASVRELTWEHPSISPSTIHKLLNETGIELRSTGNLGVAINEIQFSEAQILDISNSYLSGLSSKIISAQYGCDGGTIIRLLRRNGIEIRRERQFDESQTLDICTSYRSGESAGCIGVRYGCKADTILKLLRKNGVTIRDRNELRKLNTQKGRL